MDSFHPGKRFLRLRYSCEKHKLSTLQQSKLRSVTNSQENNSEAKQIEDILYDYINITSIP